MTHNESNLMQPGDDWRQLVAPYCDGLLAPEELARLEALLVSDPEVCREFIRLVQVHTLLARNFGQPATGKPATLVRQPKWLSRHWVRYAAAAAVLIALGAGVIAYLSPRKDSAAVVARLTRTAGAAWQAAAKPDNSPLTTGEKLQLVAGQVEIEYATGAKVVLQGPAEYVIGSEKLTGKREKSEANSGFLAFGKLTAHVPPAAKGFAVQTPDGLVTDLGTEFGVVVRGQGSEVRGQGEKTETKLTSNTEVHVFLGKVDVVPGDQLAQASAQTNPSDPSTIRHPPSTIL
ncbi:MAG: FecR family protein, partial [Planctomycetales bacterium]|nr:FecR family protein [Planctomycetales bacterium]